MATDRFSEKKEIGKGGFGVVYSGSLKKKDVAVKKILKDSRGEFKDFLAELGSIDGTGHVNLVRLEGWCCSINNYMFWCFGRQHVELFLVYELVPNGTLHQHLYENPEVLSWEMRYIISLPFRSFV
jgi:serine/threonine protein kinase